MIDNMKEKIMSIENYSLAQEFPEFRSQIHELKTSNNHFSKLFAEYDELAHEIHRIETGGEAASDERLEILKKQRLNLKDELFGMLKSAA
jgi:uncharacterized protein YdcH (DUF465 family)